MKKGKHPIQPKATDGIQFRKEAKAVIKGGDAKIKSNPSEGSGNPKPRKHEVKDLKIHLDIFANALDFISNSLDPILKDSSAVSVKYSILHLHAGVELIFKEILKEEHWSLIFQKVDEADKQHLRTGNFISVNHATALTRLNNICGIRFDETELFSLEDLRRRRNIIEHYVFPVEDDPSALKSTVSEVLLTVLNLIETYFDENEIKGHASEHLKNIRKKSQEFREFVEKKLLKIQPKIEELAKEFDVITCPSCYQNTFVLDDKFRCLYCSYTDDPEEVATSYIENVMKVSEYYEVTQGGHFPLEDCPECGAHTLVVRDNDYLCFSCLQKWEHSSLDTCDRCGSLYHANEEDGTICSSCWGDIISSPD
ncbi:hypothetical protein WSM22_20030 [Cytophagales bacterium WSM2-2]|nr:hypothetical protein WSM22_20030 [Cytophagales bacterium WSM2-2]